MYRAKQYCSTVDMIRFRIVFKSVYLGITQNKILGTILSPFVEAKFI